MKISKYIFLFTAIILAHLAGYSQVFDDFSDGDFTNNPTWSGNEVLFIIENEVLRSNSPGAANYYLSTPNVLMDDVQWEFYIKLAFSTSGSNYVDVYLVADNIDLTGVQNGYFLRIGDTDDKISLYKKSSGSESEIIIGVEDLVNSSSNNTFDMRITRTADGEWSIFYDKNQTGTFASGGTVVDNEIITTTDFGIFIEQSGAAGAINKHFFDNFSVAPIPVDETPPVIIGGVANSSTEFQLFFSEALDQTSAEDANNYQLSGVFSTVSTAELSATDPTIVILTIDNPIPNGTLVPVTVTNVEDLAGNSMSAQSIDILYFTPDPSNYKNVVFNEIFADPTPVVGLPNAEYIEIFNASEGIFDLANWTLVNTAIAKTLSSVVLFPGEFVILCDVANAELFEEFGTVIGIPSFTALSNSSDSLTLLNPQGVVIDIVSYSDSWYNDPVKKDGGYSLELINPYTECSGSNNWNASNDEAGGTPGSQNSIFDETPDTTSPAIASYQLLDDQTLQINFSESMDATSLENGSYIWNQGIENTVITVFPNLATVQLELNMPLETGILYTLSISEIADCSGNLIDDNTTIEILYFTPDPSYYKDVVFNEIFADPTPIIGLPEAEYLEIFNASNGIFDLANWTLVNTTTAKTLTSVILSPGEFVIFCDAANTELFEQYGTVIGIPSFSALANTSDSLTLLNPQGEIIDIVSYADSWYKDPVKKDGGYSLELINPFTECSGKNNWSASNNETGGTPGAQNSIFDESPDTTPPTISSFQLLTNQLLQVNFSERMDATSLENGLYTWNEGIENSTITILPNLEAIQIELNMPLETGTSYILSIGNISDCSGNLIIENTTIEIFLGEQPEKYDLLISEIMADPSPTVGLPEGEYFELYNASDKILEIAGIKLNDKVFTESRILMPGAFLLCIDDDLAFDFSNYPDAYILPDLGTTYFTNGGRNLSLFNANNEEIDRANYQLDWYRDIEKQDGGYSLERINLEEPCRAGDNWKASIDPKGGTPEAVNSVNDNTPDLTPPMAVTVFVQDSIHIQILFSETIDELSVIMATISINPELQIGSVEAIAPDFNAINVQLVENIQPAIIYSVSLSGIADCVGNESTKTETLYFGLPQEGAPGDLLINEVLFYPQTGGSDFVEVVNVSDKIISLQNWALQNQSATTQIITENAVLIFPGEYLVFTANPSNIAQEYPFGKPENYFRMSALPSYNNSSGSVILLDSDENIIDQFDYLESYQFSLLNSFKGVSLERMSFTRPTNDPRNWTSAAETVGFATPGYLNSQYNPEGTARTNFEFDNEIFSPDNDGYQDILNLNYKLEAPGYVATIEIYDRSGRLLKTLENNLLLATSGTISWDGVTDDGIKARIGPHIYVITLYNLAGNTETIKLPCIVAGRLSN